MTRPTNSETGFTLIEVLIAMFIFALISVGTMTSLFQSLAAQSRLESSMGEITQLQQMRTLIRTDMQTLTLRQSRDSLGSFDSDMVSTDGEALLRFTRRGRANPGGLAARGDMQRVSYIFRNGQFIRAVLPHENPAQNSAPIERVLVDNLSAAELTGIQSVNGNIIRLQSWRVPVGQPELLVRAIELRLTDQAGAQTTHLFEIDR